MLNLIESLSFLPPQQDEESSRTRSRSPPTDRSASARKAAGSNAAAEKLPPSAVRSQPTASSCATPHATAAEAKASVGSSAPTRPRAFGAAAGGGSAPPAQLAASRCVEATGVSIARRAVPVIAWSQGGGGSDYFGEGSTPTTSELTRNLEILQKGDVHTRLAAFEGRFGPPERLEKWSGSVDETKDADAPLLNVKNAWPGGGGT